MVYHGPSRGCLTCKTRRKKCDGTRPACHRCRKSKRACGGYLSDDRNAFRISTAQPLALPSTRARKCTLPPATDLQSDSIPKEATESIIDEAALRSFLYEFCIPPENSRISHGFLGSMEAILLGQPPVATLVRACQALSHALCGRQRGRSIVARRGQRRYDEAVSRFAKEIADPDFTVSEEAILTAMLLGFYEIVMADCHRRSSLHSHVQGISAMLGANASGDICAALRSYACRPKSSSIEDLADIAYCYDIFQRTFQGLNYHASLSTETSCSLKDQVDALLTRLEAWHGNQHQLSAPRSIGEVPDTPNGEIPAVGFWPGSVDMYFDLAVAEAWNTYRVLHCQLLLLKASLSNSNLSPQALRQVEDAVHGILASISYHCFEDPRCSLNASVPRLDDIEPGKCIGGVLLMQHLYKLSRLNAVSERAKRYASGCLRWIAARMGIGQAQLLATSDGSFLTQPCLDDIRATTLVGLLISMQNENPRR